MVHKRTVVLEKKVPSAKIEKFPLHFFEELKFVQQSEQKAKKSHEIPKIIDFKLVWIWYFSIIFMMSIQPLKTKDFLFYAKFLCTDFFDVKWKFKIQSLDVENGFQKIGHGNNI